MSARPETYRTELLAGLEWTIGVALRDTILKVVKSIAAETGLRRGTMRCPRCKSGTLLWSFTADSDQIHVMCHRVVEVRAGQTLYCTSFLE